MQLKHLQSALFFSTILGVTGLNKTTVFHIYLLKIKYIICNMQSMGLPLRDRLGCLWKKADSSANFDTATLHVNKKTDQKSSIGKPF